MRHLFRLLKQEIGEKFDKFLLRLKNQAEKCNFSSIEENIIYQIVEKNCPSELRKKILAAGDKISLAEIIIEANALEVVCRQIGKFSSAGTNAEVNMLET